MLKFKILGKNETIHIEEKRDFIFPGGEANIYRYKNDVLKVYHDKNKMVPLDKINELSKLDKNFIIKPKDILLDKNDEIVGFTMDNVDNGTLPIMRLFNTKFWKMNNLNINKMMKIIEFIQETLIFIHKKECLIVDFNDTNFLINESLFSIVYFLDICAWKTKSFLPMAISPFVKDYSEKNFNELTDWFSCGILFFQLITGIHPYRGTHPLYGNKKEDTIQRMKDCASVYDGGVSVNSAVRMSIIPSNYDKWFRNLFQYGKKEFPPGTAGIITSIRVDKITSKDNLIFNLYKEFDTEIIFYKYILGKEIIIFENSLKIDNKIYKNCTKNIIFDGELNPYEIQKKDNFLILKNLIDNIEKKTDIKIENFLIIDNELYCKNQGFIFHIKLKKMKKLLIMIKNKWNIMQYSSKIFPGIIYQNIIGKCWFFIPVYQKNWGVSVNIKELDDYRIIDCERKKNILIVIGKKKTELKKFVIKFNNNFNEYEIINQKNNIDIINFVVLENGIVINSEENEIEIFDSRIEKDKIKTVKGDIINMIMVNKGNEVLLIENKKLKKITLK